MTGMNAYFAPKVERLYASAFQIINTYVKDHRNEDDLKLHIPEVFKREFFGLVDQVNLSLIEDKDNFYGYFLFQLSREIRFDISSPTAVKFKGSKFVICFNPVIFLTLNIKQMETTIKHEILHILSGHLSRAAEYKVGYKAVAVNMAMDVVVNTCLDYLPPYATTLERVNLNYLLKLPPFEPFEYYVEKIQAAVELLDVIEDEAQDEDFIHEKIEAEYHPEKTHDIWEESDDIDERTLGDFTQKIVDASQKGNVPAYLKSLIASLKNSRAELPWNLYLRRLMGAVVSHPKKTTTRKNRRQPERLDLQGELKSHKAKIMVALDISGSISDAEFYQAVTEVIGIVKNYNHEITVVECDNEIRREYEVKSIKDIKDRSSIRGGTRFTPVFEYANTKKVNLLIFFTDGKGEDKLRAIPKGYKVLWVVSGAGEAISLKEPYGAVKKLNRIERTESALKLHDVVRDGYSMNNQEKSHI